MPVEVRYASEPTNVKPYDLSDDELLGIGRLIRACAEIEDIINLHLYKLAEITEGAGVMLLGRMSTSARLKLMEAFSTSRSAKARKMFQEAFDNEHYRHVVRCRNTVAHGLLLGVTEDDLIAFQVQDPQGFEAGTLVLSVNAYDHRAFAAFATQAEHIIPQLEEGFGLQESRETRRAKALSPHKKSQPKAKQKAGRERPGRE